MPYLTLLRKETRTWTLSYTDASEKNVRKFLGGNPVKRHYSARERFGKKVQAPETELSHTESKVVYFYTFS